MAASTNTRRLFFALLPDQIIQRQLQRVADKVKAGDCRQVPPNNLHLTLAYLGPTNAWDQACYESVARDLSCPQFELSLSKLEVFERARVAVMSSDLDDSPGLARLHERLIDALNRQCGFEPESRPFHPHVTLHRHYTAPCSGHAPTALTWKVTQIALVESVSKPGGVCYEPLGIWTLPEER